MNLLKNKKKVHFIGVGGIGMSALAQLLIKLGYEVSGSDLVTSELIKKLENMGIDIYLSHEIKNLEGVDLVVASSSISEDNPEIIAVKEKKIPLVPRAEMLAELMKDKISIAVTGTHGKTTTTSLISHILYTLNLKPSVVVGAEVFSLGSNAVLGDSKYFVAEADESDASFLYLNPTYSVITNIEREHMDYYKDLDEVIKIYAKFANKTKDDGCLIALADDKNIEKILCNYKKDFLTFGLKGSCDLRALNIKNKGFSSEFDCLYKGNQIGSFLINIAGVHNIFNALAAILVALKLKLKVENIKEALASYTGAKRRFEIKGKVNEVTVIEDYAHHPTEIEATIKAAFDLKPSRVIVVFQPHRYSRTKDFSDSFSKSLLQADYLILTDIYSASEKPIEGITTKIIYDNLLEEGHKSVRLISKDMISAHLTKIVKAHDVVLIMGAGDIGEISDELVQKLKKQDSCQRASV